MSLSSQLGTWHDLLSPVFQTQEFANLIHFLKKEKNFYEVYPKFEDVFRAFTLCHREKFKVLIIGQDPYFDKNRATGLCFANSADTLTISPSLRNIFEELERQYDTVLLDPDITLESWAKQGVLLLNTALTVRENEPESHMKYWRPVTEQIIRLIYQDVEKRKEHIYVLLWGKFAQNVGQNKGENSDYVHILTCPHPSPLARGGFKHNGHFITVNEGLKERQKNPIRWI